jgi:hypothetical protein
VKWIVANSPVPILDYVLEGEYCTYAPVLVSVQETDHHDSVSVLAHLWVVVLGLMRLQPVCRQTRRLPSLPSKASEVTNFRFPSRIHHILTKLGAGRKVIADVTIPRAVVKSVFHTTPEGMVKHRRVRVLAASQPEYFHSYGLSEIKRHSHSSRNDR